MRNYKNKKNLVQYYWDVSEIGLLMNSNTTTAYEKTFKPQEDLIEVPGHYTWEPNNFDPPVDIGSETNKF